MILDPTVQQLFDLSGKVALITGATGHLGSALARALAEAGANVVAASRRLTDARVVSESLRRVRSDQVHYGVELDQMDETSLQRGFEAAVEAAGHIDVLVNNGHEAVGKDWTNITAAEFNRQLANATAYFLLARLLRDHAVARKSSASVVMLGSMYGLVGSYPDAYADLCAASPAAYHALKGSIIQMTRHLAVYWAKDLVRVNAISPGPFPSPQTDPELMARLEKKVPLGRIGQPHELKGAIVFLASEASSFMTGQNLVIDGGWTAW